MVGNDIKGAQQQAHNNMNIVLSNLARKNVKIWFFVFLVPLLFFLYRSAFHAPFIIDDNAKIVDNADIRTFPNFSKLIYKYSAKHNFHRNDPSRPLTYLTYAFNYSIGKLNPVSYRIFNLLIHIINAFLVLVFAQKIYFYLLKPGYNRLLPFAAALIFAVHPVAVFSVSYSYNRADILCLLFYVLTLVLFIKYRENNVHRGWYYGASVLSFILALASKPTAVTFPAILLLVDYVLYQKLLTNKIKISFKQYCRKHIIFLGILALYFLFRLVYLGGIGDREAEKTLDRVYYVVMQPHVYMRYFELLILPLRASILHSLIDIKNYDIRLILSYTALFSVIIILCRGIINFIRFKPINDINRLFVFTFSFFLITIAPAASIFPTSMLMQENRIYLPSIGFIMFFVYVCGRYLNKNVFLVITFLYAGLFCYLTYNRNLLFADPLRLLSDAIRVNSKNDLAYFTRGNLYKDKGDYEHALADFTKAIELSPLYEKAHNNRGNIYCMFKDYRRAIYDYKEIIKIDPQNSDAYLNLAVAYHETGADTQEVIRNFKIAADLGSETALKNLESLGVSHNPTGAKILQKNVNPSALSSADGVELFRNRRYKEAIEAFTRLIQEQPENEASIRNNIGLCYIQLKEYDNAEKELLRALSIDKNYEKAYYNLGVLYEKKQDTKKAMEFYKKVISLNPGHEKAKQKLSSQILH